MTDKTDRYWHRVKADGTWLISPITGELLGPPPGEDLAAMRAGLGRRYGEVVALWPHYRSEVDDELAKRGKASVEQRAEHAVLSLYGLHQQSKDRSMHKPGVRLGKALRVLRHSENFTPEAVDRRVNAAATTTSPDALLIQLRGLIDLLRTIDQPIDYDALLWLVRNWHREETRRRARIQWASDYQSSAKPSEENS
jgi:CRISPR system Cascade subunit CasB